MCIATPSETGIVWRPTPEHIRRSRLVRFMTRNGLPDYDALFHRSVEDPAWFWNAVNEDLMLRWIRPFREVQDRSAGLPWTRWWVGGRYNYVENCLDRHIPGRGDEVAIRYEAEEGTIRTLTYRELLAQVNRLALALRRLGIQKGDRIGIFMPFTPECAIATLAVSRIGAVYVPVFSGYGAPAVATRLQDAEAVALITVDGFPRRGHVVATKETADEAMQQVPTVRHVIVQRRLGRQVTWAAARDRAWDELLAAESGDCPAEVTDPDDPFMIIYTSGTTGRPKGTVHVHGGFPIKSTMDMAYGFDVQEGDTMFWLTDLGWMMGPWEIIGVLTLGGTILLYDGAIDYPEPDRLWDVLARHHVIVCGISPTAIRAQMQHGVERVRRHDLQALRVLGSTGEPWNPESWLWYFRNIGGGRCPVINYSGGTEVSGGILWCTPIQPQKPCSFTGPALGMDADVYDEHGRSLRGAIGELVLRNAWPGMTHGFWRDRERYLQAYWSRWPDVWVHGDFVRVDEDGFWFTEGRSDDTIKVAGKRLGPAEVESVLVAHPAILEAAAIGVPDEVKGEAVVCFVVLKPEHHGSEPLRQELLERVGHQLGKALRPRNVLFASDLPKTRNNKIMRRVIRAKHLGAEMGDLTALENPGAVEAIAQAW